MLNTYLKYELIMIKQFIVSSIISSGFLFASTSSFSSDRNNSSDLIYGTGTVITSASEPYIAGLTTTTNNQATDLVYGDFLPKPSPSEAPERLGNNLDNVNDMIYGS